MRRTYTYSALAVVSAFLLSPSAAFAGGGQGSTELGVYGGFHIWSGDNELGVYEWLEGRDNPRKENDDDLDALRYEAMYLDSGVGQLEVRVFGGNDNDDDWEYEDWAWR